MTTNDRWRVLVLVFCCCLLPLDEAYSRGSQNRYPNELKGFSLYAKYLAPLRPGVSDSHAVGRVLGDTAAVKRNAWTIIPTFTMEHGQRLHELILRPDGVIPMAAVNLPAHFTHCHTSMSEFNISFDVYSDNFGLEYWLHEEDSRWGKKGDLFRIVYGRRRRPYPPNTIC